MWWKRGLWALAIVGLLGTVGWQEHKLIENADRVHRMQVQETTHARLLLEENARLGSKLQALEYKLDANASRHDREFTGRLADFDAQNDALYENLQHADKNLQQLQNEITRHWTKASDVVRQQNESLEQFRAALEKFGALKRWPSVPRFMHDAVVRIGMDQNDTPASEKNFCIGSGFKIGPRVIGTAKHVAFDEFGNRRIGLWVEINGQHEPIKDVVADPEHDLALLVMVSELDGFIPVPRAVAIEVGDPLFVIGNPAGTSITATHGFLATKDSLFSGLPGSEPLWQTGANAYGGNSGGPVFDANTGDLIGVLVSGVRGAPNVSMFVPVEYVRALLDRYEHR